MQNTDQDLSEATLTLDPVIEPRSSNKCHASPDFGNFRPACQESGSGQLSSFIHVFVHQVEHIEAVRVIS